MSIDIEKLAIEAGFYKHPIHGLITKHSNGSWVGVADKLKQFAEAYHKAKCEQAEPVAWISEDENFIEFRKDALLELSYKENEIFPLYTTPQDQSAEIARVKERERKLVEAVNKLNTWVFEVAPDDYQALVIKDDVIKLIEAQNE